MLSGLVTDLRQVVRGLAASRTFTGVAVLSLAIGIGANAAIFSVIRTLLLDRLAVRNPVGTRARRPLTCRVAGA
jgi:hypothetical protein